MAVSATYCQTRRALERRSWALTSRLAALTVRLFQRVGTNPPEFRNRIGQCRSTRREVAESRLILENHRRDHGCGPSRARDLVKTGYQGS